MKQIVEKKLNEVRAKLRAMPKAYAQPKNTADRQKLLVAITQQVWRFFVNCFFFFFCMYDLLFESFLR